MPISMFCALLGVLPLVAAVDSQRSSSALRLRNRQDTADGKETSRMTVTVNAPAVEQRLVICNAYASPKPLDVIRVNTRQSLTTGLAYKQCRELSLALDEGEQLDFKAGGLDVGTFYATGVPKSAASLLLIPHRRTPHAVGCSFQSHAFSEVNAPQVAVIDAYKGKSSVKDSTVKITEDLPAGDGKSTPTRIEENLKYNSVIALNPGKYEVSLAGLGSNTATLPLNANGAGRYVVMRLGVDDGGHYPQELIVFPNAAMSGKALWSFVLVAMCGAFLHMSSVM